MWRSHRRFCCYLLALSSLPTSLALCQLLCPESAVLPVWSEQKQICQQQWSTIAWHVFPRKEISLAFDFQRQPADGLGKKTLLPFSPCLHVISFNLWYNSGWVASPGDATQQVHFVGAVPAYRWQDTMPWMSCCALWNPALALMCFSLGGCCRSQHSSANMAGHCMVLPLLQWAAGLMRKGTQAREGMLENWKGRKRKLLPSQERAGVRRDQWPRWKQEAFQY